MTSGLVEAEESQDGIEADRTYRLLRGYDGIIRHLAAGLEPANTVLRLNTTATRIAWRTGEVRVTAESSGASCELKAAKAVITLPLGILKSNSVQFQPDPPAIRSAIAHLEMGNVIKLLIHFREPFWERARLPAIHEQHALRDMTFLHSQGAEASFPTWWTMLPVRTNLLMGWAAGPAARKLGGRSPAQMLRLGISDLAQATGLPASEIAQLVQDYRAFDWSIDPFSSGAYSYIGVGGSKSIEVLSRPVGATLYFAGEATHPGMSGTVAGAIASGYRAADQIIGSR